MNVSPLSPKQIRLVSLLALLASILLAGLGGFCLKESLSHPTGSRSFSPLLLYERSEAGETTLIFSDSQRIYTTPSQHCREVLAKNPSQEPITLQMGSERYDLEGGSSLLLPLSCYTENFQTESKGECYYFVSDGEHLQQALNSDSVCIVVLQRDIALPRRLSFSSPCCLDLGSFRLTDCTELLYESPQEGSLRILSQGQKALTLYANAPHTQIFFPRESQSYPPELWDFYLKAESVNGTPCNPNRNPVTDEAMLEQLATAPICPTTEHSTIEFTKLFSLTKDYTFREAYSLSFTVQPQFNDHILSFQTQNSQIIRIHSQCEVDSSAIHIDAPNAHLIWEGIAPPSPETLCETMEVSTINREDPEPYRLGGNSAATLLSFTVHHENLTLPIEYSIEDKLLVGTLGYLDNAYDLQRATVSYECENGRLEFEAAHYNEDGTLDLTRRTVILLIDQEGNYSRYRVETRRKYNDLPVIEIVTENHATVESKTQYINATIQILGNGSGFTDLEPTEVQIRGRGNSTWKWEKKPYKLKFSQDLSLFGLAPSNEWALLSNYADKSLIRNPLAYEMAKELRFSYTPTQYCVDVFVNGVYQGIYTFGEHLEAAEGRVELDHSFTPQETGYLIEIGGVDTSIHKKGVDYFHAGTLRFALVKSPGQGELSSTQFDYISNYLIEADKAVVNGGDWRQYLDEDSLVDWILLMELTNNTDCAFRRSCYFTKNADTKLMIGPVWDFDLAFGNFNRDDSSYRSWATTTDDDYVGNTWTAYLLQDKAFVDALYHRWNQIKDTLLARAGQIIDQASVSLKASATENFRRWDVLNIRTEMQHSDVVNYNTHEKQLQYLKDFLRKRASWMDQELKRLYEGGVYEIPEIKEE